MADGFCDCDGELVELVVRERLFVTDCVGEADGVRDRLGVEVILRVVDIVMVEVALAVIDSEKVIVIVIVTVLDRVTVVVNDVVDPKDLLMCLRISGSPVKNRNAATSQCQMALIHSVNAPSGGARIAVYDSWVP